MAQKKYAEKGSARPVVLTDRQVAALAAGEIIESIEDHSRPRDVAEEDVKALIAGKEIDVETFAEVAGSEPEEQSRPHDLTEEDVKALIAGKEIRLEKRARIPG